MMIMKLARFVAGAAALVAIFGAVFAIGAVALGHGGLKAYAMQTPSMSPLIRPGDLVIVRSVDPDEIRVHDVITFRSPLSGLQVTHRVVNVTETPQGPVFETRGDANAAADPWVLRYQGAGWEVTKVIPGAAALLAKLTSSAGRLVLAALLFVVVFILLLPSANSPEKPLSTQAVA